MQLYLLNWRGCSSYKKYVVNRKARINEARDKQVVATKNVGKIFHSSRVTQGKSFASLLHPQEPVSTHSQRKSPIIDEFLKLAHMFKDHEELTLEQQIQKFLSEFRSMPKIAAKTEFLRLFNEIQNSFDP